MSGAATQQTLTMEDADAEREKPDTFRWCHDCEEFVLRSRWESHDEHDWRAQRQTENDGGDGDGNGGDDDEDDVVEKVGSWYDITLSYSVDYRFKIPAYSEHAAEEIAKELKLDARPADAMHVHTEKREVKEIYADDEALPDDYDPYGGERLLDAIERENEDGDSE